MAMKVTHDFCWTTNFFNSMTDTDIAKLSNKGFWKRFECFLWHIQKK